MFNYAAKSDVGNQRDNNEDRYLSCPELGLWVVADGVGGHDAGEIASKIACDVIKSEVESGSTLEEAIELSHIAIKDAPAQGVGKVGMASTIVALLINGDEFQISWVGDSRAYLWCNQELKQLSHDQSLVQRLLDEQVITAEEAQNHPRRNLVIQALGQEGLDKVEVESMSSSFSGDELIMLCSDGLTDYVSDHDIAKTFLHYDNLEVLVNRLIAEALSTEGKDNITALAVDLSQREDNNATLDINIKSRVPLYSLLAILLGLIIYWFYF